MLCTGHKSEDNQFTAEQKFSFDLQFILIAVINDTSCCATAFTRCLISNF